MRACLVVVVVACGTPSSPGVEGVDPTPRSSFAPFTAVFYDLLAVEGLDDHTGSGLTIPQAQALVSTHNAVRGAATPTPVPPLAPLVWDPSLAASAQAWAERCEWAHSPSPRGPAAYTHADPPVWVGENLYASTLGVDVVVRDAVSGWASEAAFYDHAANTCEPGQVCGHYTALVWRDTTAVGCGVAVCAPLGGTPWEQGTVLVCQYGPGGNLRGQRPYAAASEAR